MTNLQLPTILQAHISEQTLHPLIFLSQPFSTWSLLNYPSQVLQNKPYPCRRYKDMSYLFSIVPFQRLHRPRGIAAWLPGD